MVAIIAIEIVSPWWLALWEPLGAIKRPGYVCPLSSLLSLATCSMRPLRSSERWSDPQADGSLPHHIPPAPLTISEDCGAVAKFSR